MSPRASQRVVIVGVDEAGRGPLAGPVCVAALALFGEAAQVPATWRRVRDSKQLSARQREARYAELLRLRRAGALDFEASFSSAAYIDAHGIVAAVRGAAARTLDRLMKRLNLASATVRVFLDGSLAAPRRYARQKTVIGGDETVLAIALASIVAKVRRDRRMVRYAKAFPGYGIEEHMGYGTAAHYRALKKLGISPLHRRTFLRRIGG